jgi:UDP-N-acetylglucosamine 2-epimerase (non-hydrolysing)/GDP/UDP-N,N'-diacetylbacillosamine 2-epimerase (hydrolysing)
MSRKICVITGTRADYGILSPVMNEIKSTPGLKLSLVVTGMHLMKEFGYTIREIKKDGFKICEKVGISYKEDTPEAVANSIGLAISKFSKVFAKIKPDIILTLGDRGEMLAAAIVGNYMNIPVAHIHGGEISGHVDGVLRHAITKISHIHFPATKNSRERILSLGEDHWRIFVAGAPALDKILKMNYSSKKELHKKYNLEEGEKLILVLQHPVSTQVKVAAGQMKNTMEAVSYFKLPAIVIYPNADAGGRKMISVINKYKKYHFIKVCKSLPHKDYLGLLRIATVLVGNSSSGIIEALCFNLPVVNIGIRQEGRERGANIIDAQSDKKKIIKAINKALHTKIKKYKNPYGNGQASRRIAKVLAAIKLDKKLLEKRITY